MADAGEDDRGLYTHVGSMFDGTICADAAELAGVYGGPVFEPTSWPLTVDEVHYVLAAQPPSPPFGSLPPSYRIFVTSPDDVRPPVVLGSEGPSSVIGTQAGWRAVGELAEVDGFVNEQGGTTQISVQRDGQSITLGLFASVSEAVATAKGLRRVDPPV